MTRRDVLYKELMELHELLSGRLLTEPKPLTREQRRREQELVRLLSLAICRECNAEYDCRKSRGMWKGYCSAKCQHAMARKLGWRPQFKDPTEYEVLKRAGEIGDNFVT